MRLKAFLAGIAGVTTLVMSCSEPTAQRSESITLAVRSGGVYDVPIGIGKHCCFPFMLDTGASDVIVSPEIFRAMVGEGYIRRSDMQGSQVYITANGTQMRAYTFRMPPMRLGNYVVHGALASVSPDMSLSRMLLGQSFLSKLPPWSIDYRTHTLRFSYDRIAPMPERLSLRDDAPIELCTPVQLIASTTCIYLPGLLIDKKE